MVGVVEFPGGHRLALPVRDKIGRAKYIPEESVKAEFEKIESDLSSQTAALIDQGGQS